MGKTAAPVLLNWHNIIKQLSSKKINSKTNYSEHDDFFLKQKDSKLRYLKGYYLYGREASISLLWAANKNKKITDHSSSNNRNLFSSSPGSWKSKVIISANSVSGKGSLPGGRSWLSSLFVPTEPFYTQKGERRWGGESKK